MKKLDLAADNYDDLQLHEDVEVECLNTPIACESPDGRILEVSFAPPFQYLGKGRDKVVISGLLQGLDSTEDVVRAAIGLRRNSIMSASRFMGIESLRLLKQLVPDAPTYSWYLQSQDGQICVMSDLTQEGGVVVAQNDRKMAPVMLERLDRSLDDITAQLQSFVDGLPFGVGVTFDTYFAILAENSGRLFLGDFDAMAVQQTSIDRSIYNRKQAEHWLECVIETHLSHRGISYDFQRWAHQHELPRRKK